jgi:hypothetical protein
MLVFSIDQFYEEIQVKILTNIAFSVYRYIDTIHVTITT